MVTPDYQTGYYVMAVQLRPWRWLSAHANSTALDLQPGILLGYYFSPGAMTRRYANCVAHWRCNRTTPASFGCWGLLSSSKVKRAKQFRRWKERLSLQTAVPATSMCWGRPTPAQAVARM